MERYSRFADPTTGKLPFIEPSPPCQRWRMVDHLFYYLRVVLLGPALLGIRIVPFLAVLATWYTVSMLPRQLRRLPDKLFSGILLLLLGYLGSVKRFRATRSNRRSAKLSIAFERYHVCGQLTTPVDVLLYTHYFAPQVVLFPKGLVRDGSPQANYHGKAVSPCSAFLMCLLFDRFFHSSGSKASDADTVADVPESAAIALAPNPRHAPPEYSSSESPGNLALQEHLTRFRRVLLFPENCFTNGSILLAPNLTSRFVEGTNVYCVSAAHVWRYRSLVHPFPTVASMLADLCEPFRFSAIFVVPLSSTSISDIGDVMSGMAIASGASQGVIGIRKREEYYRFVTEEKK